LTRLRVALLALRTIIDTLVVAAGLAAPAFNWTTDPTGARLTCLALRFAVATVMAVDLGVDALVVAHRPVVATLALALFTGLARCASVATTATVVGVGANILAYPTAANIASHAQAAIPVLTVLEPLAIETVRGHLAAETRDEHHPIVAEVVTGGILIKEKFAKGGFLTFGYVAASRGGTGCAE